MMYDVSYLQTGEWVTGVVFGALYTTRVNSEDERAAIETAKRKRRREQDDRYKQHTADIDDNWQYCTPRELVPYGRNIAQVMGTTFYVGKACRKHPLNNIRYTSGKVCAVCSAERHLGI